MFNKDDRVVITGSMYDGKHAVVVGMADARRCVVKSGDVGTLVVPVNQLVPEHLRAAETLAAAIVDGDGFVKLTMRALVRDHNEVDWNEVGIALHKGRGEALAVISSQAGWVNPESGDPVDGGVDGFEITLPDGTVLLTGGVPVPKIEVA